MKRVDGRQDLARAGVGDLVDEVQRNFAFAQQVHVQWREHQSGKPRLRVHRLDQRIHRRFLDVDQYLLQGALDPRHFRRDLDTEVAQGPGLFLQPLPMTLDVAQAHLLQCLPVDQAGRGQAFEVVKSDNMQRGAFGLGQCGGPVERRAVFHQWRDDQHQA
ncbi:hypothetical protein D3C76_1254690 [compost metagenome]